MADRLFIVETDRIYSVGILKETEKTYVPDRSKSSVRKVFHRTPYYISARILKSDGNVFKSEVEAWKCAAAQADKRCEILTNDLYIANTKRLEIHERLKQA